MMRWKMSPKETGLRSIGARPRSHNLYLDGEEIATVYPNGGGWSRKQDGWYWVVVEAKGIPYMNTCNDPVPTVQEAKEAVKAYLKTHMLAGIPK